MHGWELDDILSARRIRLEPGDAVCVYSGREAWQEHEPRAAYSKPFGPAPSRPGLHISCLPFLRDHDVSVLVWDMLDHLPIGYDVPWAVHAALFAYGVALLDNALLEPLAQACVEEGRDEFMLISPRSWSSEAPAPPPIPSRCSEPGPALSARGTSLGARGQGHAVARPVGDPEPAVLHAGSPSKRSAGAQSMHSTRKPLASAPATCSDSSWTTCGETTSRWAAARRPIFSVSLKPLARQTSGIR